VTAEAIRQVVLDVLGEIAPEIDRTAVPRDRDLRRALDIDSMDHLNLLVGIGQRLGFEIPESDAAQLHTLDQLVAYLAAHVSGR
jgi:acyl carrier protein